MMLRWFFLLLALFSATVHASIESYQFNSIEEEARYQTLIEELRCLVCQNQNLADSNAQLAQDLRRKTYEMVSSGKSDKEVIDYMVQRYGDFVLYRPPFRATTLLLWLGPFLILAIALVTGIRFIRRTASTSAAPFSEEELQRAKQLLAQTDEEKKR